MIKKQLRKLQDNIMKSVIKLNFIHRIIVFGALFVTCLKFKYYLIKIENT